MGHPPCPPRAYKKLYAFLDRSLSNSVAGVKRAGSSSISETPSRAGSASSTPRKSSKHTRTPPKTAATPHKLQNTTSKSTPLKKAITHEESEARSQTPQKSKVLSHGLPGSTIIPDAPAWVMTSIRSVCKTLSTPAPRTSTWSRPPISRSLPPHVFAGVSSILYFISRVSAKDEDDFDEETLEFLEPILIVKDKENDEDYKEVVNALVVAVYFLALARRRSPLSEGEGETKKLDKKTFSEMRQTALVSIGLPPTERRHREDVDQWIAVIMQQRWANGKEWFENIPQAGELAGDDAYLSDEDGYGEYEERGKDAKRQKITKSGRSLAKHSSRKGLLPGLGTMMQDRVDWLSDDRKEDYLEWKAAVLARIEQIQKTASQNLGVLPV
ncbi:origin recognition complex, subunit 6 [Aspergillus pseudotamarii]|uniref:Origin recognition complex, subunit 6 n=1 Tax=Aspergillus pseudotamarii TaxID=132259 RepID=A0A5N6SIM5_ASPPS|nr:origin recognition complex, subunit 6 [Aspergillus pseudotamarii]KAE8133521.1 origin recognition complex, subunit 6 [Aspergillus pseudotamarii]